MMELEFILAQEKDLDIIMTLFTDAIDKLNRNGINQWDSTYPDRNTLKEDIMKKQLYIGLFKETIISAYVITQEYDEQYDNCSWKFPNSTFSIIHRLCINPMFQNKGYGTLTVMHIENQLKRKGVEYIRLDVFPLNTSALKMYEKLGYSKVGIAKWRGLEFYLMEKKL